MGKARTSKNKGRLGQNEVRDKILDHFPELEPADVKCAIMGEKGCDIHFSPAAYKKLPLSVEVKRRKTGVQTLYNWLQQAESQEKGEPVVFFRQDRQGWLAVMDLDYFLKILKGNDK